MLRQCRTCGNEVEDNQADSLDAYNEFVESGVCYSCQDSFDDLLDDDFVDHEWDYDENDDILAQQELEDFENFYGPTEDYYAADLDDIW